MRSIRSNLPEETSMRSIRSEEPRCGKFVDFRKMVLKNEYTVVRFFNNNSDLMMYLERKPIYMVCKKIQPVQCSLTDCNTTDCHKMQMKYYNCSCSEECQLKFRAKHCLKSNEIELAIGLIPHCYCRINGITIEDRKPRGMCELIKEKLKLMLNDDPDLYPERISMWRKHFSLFMFFVCDVAKKKHV